jgi:hypothetical protein
MWAKGSSVEEKPWYVDCLGFVASSMAVRIKARQPMGEIEETSRLVSDARQAIHQMHRDIVRSPYPASIESLASTPRCATQGMYARNRLITVQGHPEFTGDIVQELLERRHEGGILDDETFNEAMSRVSRDHDGVTVAEAFLRFLLGK